MAATERDKLYAAINNAYLQCNACWYIIRDGLQQTLQRKTKTRKERAMKVADLKKGLKSLIYHMKVLDQYLVALGKIIRGYKGDKKEAKMGDNVRQMMIAHMIDFQNFRDKAKKFK